MQTARSTSNKSEAFFHEFCSELATKQAVKRAKIVLTGGVRSLAAMNAIVASELAHLIGLGRPFCFMPDLCPKLLQVLFFKTNNQDNPHCHLVILTVNIFPLSAFGCACYFIESVMECPSFSVLAPFCIL
jgi:hypothetical protein